MKMTKHWIENQIENYKKMISSLDLNDINDRKLQTIWAASHNTLESVMKVINLEISVI